MDGCWNLRDHNIKLQPVMAYLKPELICNFSEEKSFDLNTQWVIPGSKPYVYPKQ